MSEQPYEDDEKLASIIDVLKAAELFGEVISIKPYDIDALSTEDPEEDWAKIQVKYGHDTENYIFVDGLNAREGTISTESEPTTGHDWVSSTSIIGMKLHTNMTGYSMCGKPLSECYDFNCIHKTVGFEHIWQQDERNEYREPATDNADRPTENSFLGLPGLRYIESNQDHYYRLNMVCNSCRIYTPKNLDTCQNCDKPLKISHRHAPAARGALALQR